MPLTERQIDFVLIALRSGHEATVGNARAGATYAARGDGFVVQEMDECMLQPEEPLTERQMRDRIAARPDAFERLAVLPLWEAVGDALLAQDLPRARAALRDAVAAGDPYDLARYLDAALRPLDEPLAPADADALRAGVRYYGAYHAFMTTVRYERSARVVPAALTYLASLIARLGADAYLLYHRGDFRALAGDRDGARADYLTAKGMLPAGDEVLPATLDQALAALDAG